MKKQVFGLRSCGDKLDCLFLGLFQQINQSAIFKLRLLNCQSIYFVHLLICEAMISLVNQTTSTTPNGHEPVKQTLHLKYFEGDWYTCSSTRDMVKQKDPKDHFSQNQLSAQ